MSDSGYSKNRRKSYGSTQSEGQQQFPPEVQAALSKLSAEGKNPTVSASTTRTTDTTNYLMDKEEADKFVAKEREGGANVVDNSPQSSPEPVISPQSSGGSASPEEPTKVVSRPKSKSVGSGSYDSTTQETTVQKEVKAAPSRKSSAGRRKSSPGSSDDAMEMEIQKAVAEKPAPGSEPKPESETKVVSRPESPPSEPEPTDW